MRPPSHVGLSHVACPVRESAMKLPTCGHNPVVGKLKLSAHVGASHVACPVRDSAMKLPTCGHKLVVGKLELPAHVGPTQLAEITNNRGLFK